MSYFAGERLPNGVCRLWLHIGGCPPELVAPLQRHRRRYGDLYDWGKGEDGCLLLAATLLNRCGVPAGPALYFAAYLAGDLLLAITEDHWRLDRTDLTQIVVELIHDHSAGYMSHLHSGRNRNGTR